MLLIIWAKMVISSKSAHTHSISTLTAWTTMWTQGVVSFQLFVHFKLQSHMDDARQTY